MASCCCTYGANDPRCCLNRGIRDVDYPGYPPPPTVPTPVPQSKGWEWKDGYRQGWSDAQRPTDASEPAKGSESDSKTTGGGGEGFFKANPHSWTGPERGPDAWCHMCGLKYDDWMWLATFVEFEDLQCGDFSLDVARKIKEFSSEPWAEGVDRSRIVRLAHESVRIVEDLKEELGSEQ